jgi:hypothetical protein
MHSFILVPQLFIHIQQLILPDAPAWSHPLKILRKNYSSSSQQQNLAQILVETYINHFSIPRTTCCSITTKIALDLTTLKSTRIPPSQIHGARAKIKELNSIK